MKYWNNKQGNSQTTATPLPSHFTFPLQGRLDSLFLLMEAFISTSNHKKIEKVHHLY